MVAPKATGTEDDPNLHVNVPIEADVWMRSAGCRRIHDQFVYYDKQNPTRYMGLGRCIALPSLRDVEYEYGEGSSLHEVATGELPPISRRCSSRSTVSTPPIPLRPMS